MAALCMCVGCGGSDSLPHYSVYEVKGKVLLASGKPLPSGFVYLVSKAGDLPITPSATIEPDGSFSVDTGGSGKGAPAGEYKVRVEAPSIQPIVARSSKKAVFPPKYSDEDSSGLVVTVRPETNVLEPIVLK